MMLRSFLRLPDTRLQRGISWFYMITGLLLLSCFLLGPLFGADAAVELPVSHLADKSLVLKQMTGARITANGVLHLEQPSLALRLLAPNRDLFFLDAVHACWLLAIGVAGIVYFRKFNYRAPFSRQTLSGVRLIFLITLVFLLIAAFRGPWLNGMVLELTGNEYGYQSVDLFLLPEFWMMLVLQRVVHLFRKGYELTLDQQYTV